MQSVITCIFLFYLPNSVLAGVLSNKIDPKYEWDLLTEVRKKSFLQKNLIILDIFFLSGVAFEFWLEAQASRFIRLLP
jgi:hypothetical protein